MLWPRIPRLLLIGTAVQDLIISDESLTNPNTYDVFLELFDDTACIDQKEQLLLTTENCYANLFENPSLPKPYFGYGFSVKVVSFYGTSDGEDMSSRKIIVDYFYDDCNTPRGQSLLMVENQCSSASGREIFPNFNAIFTLRHRSTDCIGGIDKCSQIRLVAQQFYSDVTCLGNPYKQNTYPLDGYCLRYGNGTHRFSVDPLNPNYVIEMDYPLSADCSENSIGCEKCVVPLKFYVKLDLCYVFRQTDGFSWTIPRPLGGNTGGSSHSSGEEVSPESQTSCYDTFHLTLAGCIEDESCEWDTDFGTCHTKKESDHLLAAALIIGYIALGIFSLVLLTVICAIPWSGTVWKDKPTIFERPPPQRPLISSFEEGLCDCYDDNAVCVQSTCCWPCRTVDTYITAGVIPREQSRGCVVKLVFLQLLCGEPFLWSPIPIASLFLMYTRAKIRGNLGGDGELQFTDCLFVTFCLHCATCQEAREVDKAVRVQTEHNCGLMDTETGKPWRPIGDAVLVRGGSYAMR